MSHNTLHSCSFTLTLLLSFLLATGVWAAPATLTVVAGGGTVSDGPASAHYEFGVRRESDDTPLVHVFVLRNPTSVPLSLDRLQTSCGCTTAVAGVSNTLPQTIEPGQTVPIRITISPRRLLPGDTHKSVWVYTHASHDMTADPTVEATTSLEMRGTVLEDAALPTTPETIVPSTPVKSIPVRAASPTLPKVGWPAPSFAATDTLGRPFVLTARRGHPLALFFFCGCPWCADVAAHWGRVQRVNRLPPGTQTVVVFAGDRSAAREFAAAHPLEMGRTTLLPDPEGRLTEKLYRVNACPRVFALDAAGTIRYTNTHLDDQPRLAPAQVLVSRVAQSLRRSRKLSEKH